MNTTLHTKRLLLRTVKTTDLDEVFFLRTNKNVNTFIKRDLKKTKKDILEFINQKKYETSKGYIYYWVICLKGNFKMLGSICLWNFSKDRKTAEVGYNLHPDFQGLGIMNEALQKVLEFGFEDLKLDKIEAFTHKNNIKSIQLLEKNGFQLNDCRKDEENIDNIIYEVILN